MLAWMLFVKYICKIICTKFISCINYNHVYRPDTIIVSKKLPNKNYDAT